MSFGTRLTQQPLARRERCGDGHVKVMLYYARQPRTWHWASVRSYPVVAMVYFEKAADPRARAIPAGTA